ncbi:MAG: NAD(P)/FAD-dependent oxidoreductase [SAR202 cluster bacterium]|nr:NAD(P)/FAD-dependent oxidoreductase [SAR202 cluster bacterium]MQG19697.1 NAD(P)/FAD-dependent oxidoreductase [SAR202 cluster bacterium]
MQEIEYRMNQHNEELDVIIVGAGFSGLYMLYKMRKMNLKALIIERASDAGGTWFWNRYPGARCDIESIEYSYSFSDELQQEWNWSNRYSDQSEILDYINYVVKKFNLKENIVFNTSVKSATFDENLKNWIVETDSKSYSSKFCVMATGTLSSIKQPNFDGLENFKGDWYVTGEWPHEKLDFTSKKVAIIGTGSSAVQSIPVIAEEAKNLTVFQRSPNYTIPANNRPLTEKELSNAKSSYDQIREKAKYTRAGIGYNQFEERKLLDLSSEEIKKELNNRWKMGGQEIFTAGFTDVGVDVEANKIVADFVKSKIKEIVKDPNVAELLSPEDAIGCKRLCADTNYFETYNRENVELIDLNSNPINSITENGILTKNKEFKFDTIIFATGFDAMTGALQAIDITGKNGKKLKQVWKDGPKSFLGLLINGFPNLFTVTGPGSPSVLTNMMVAIEQHVEWISDCINFLSKSNLNEVEADELFQIEWMDHIEEVAKNTLRYTCNSWYVGANVPGKKRVFMPYAGGFGKYREKCDEIAENNYSILRIS